jgi:outer membrane immunogenic protein
MKNKILMTLALLWSLLTLRVNAHAQSVTATTEHRHAPEISFTYSALHTNAPVGGCGCFWTSGGSVEFAVPVWRYFSWVGEFSGEHAGAIPGFGGVGLSLISGLTGARVSHPLRKRFDPFAQGLVGVAHAFDSYFPNSSGPMTSATSFASAVGGGVDISVSRRLLVRPVQLEYQYMRLPNNATNEQHDLRLSAGIVLRLF